MKKQFVGNKSALKRTHNPTDKLNVFKVGHVAH